MPVVMVRGKSGAPGPAHPSAGFAARIAQPLLLSRCEKFAQHHSSVAYPTCQLGLGAAIRVRSDSGRFISHQRCAALPGTKVVVGGEREGQRDF